MPLTIRAITESDNIELAKIIRASLEEFDVPKIGTVYSDPTTDNLSALFQAKGSAYFIAEEDGQLLGGCGIYPTDGLPEKHAELVKLYLSPASRGRGIAKHLLEQTYQVAKETGYTHLYLESFPQLESAVSLYLKNGFSHLDQAMGNSGHHACTIWMLKEL